MIPPWNMSGVLPAIRPGKEGNDLDRSPYKVSLKHVVERFALSPERITILKGLLEYRKQIYAIGINSGFQWLDGSFMEEIETIESRPPGDLDVVTFFNVPNNTDEESLIRMNPALFCDNDAIRKQFLIDGYMYTMGSPLDAAHVKMVSYWYSMWSHRRDGTTWKGFVQVGLSPEEDSIALDTLELLQGGALS